MQRLEASLVGAQLYSLVKDIVWVNYLISGYNLADLTKDQLSDLPL